MNFVEKGDSVLRPYYTGVSKKRKEIFSRAEQTFITYTFQMINKKCHT